MAVAMVLAMATTMEMGVVGGVIITMVVVMALVMDEGRSPPHRPSGGDGRGMSTTVASEAEYFKCKCEPPPRAKKKRSELGPKKKYKPQDKPHDLPPDVCAKCKAWLDTVTAKNEWRLSPRNRELQKRWMRSPVQRTLAHDFTQINQP